MIDKDGNVLERYEYDAYGRPTILDAQYTIRDTSLYENPYLFTGRRVDILDNGSLKIQYNRNRHYDYHTGRWLTHDPLGINPNPPAPNRFDAIVQYGKGLCLYEYVGNGPIYKTDPHGLLKCDVAKFDPESLEERDSAGAIKGASWPVPRKMIVNIVSVGDDCKCGTERLRCKTCSWGATGWYSEGNRSRAHEASHIRIWRRSWRLTLIHVQRLTRRCMDGAKAQCYIEAMEKYKEAYMKRAQALNSGLDCRDYPEGPRRRAACSDRDRELEESKRLLRGAATKIWECQRMRVTCSGCSGNVCSL